MCLLKKQKTKNIIKKNLNDLKKNDEKMIK